ncbi:MAG: hypothetical protein SVP26_02185, partial [Chloroflexota bacterium]|nr:hypothetical protein [Chloroflexota bacterium]
KRNLDRPVESPVIYLHSSSKGGCQVDVFQAQALPQGARVGAPSLGKWWYAQGTVAFSIPYGIGVRFDDYPYPSERDLHSFDDMDKELLSALVVLDEE